jgi:hypothetical protein
MMLCCLDRLLNISLLGTVYIWLINHTSPLTPLQPGAQLITKVNTGWRGEYKERGGEAPSQYLSPFPNK